MDEYLSEQEQWERLKGWLQAERPLGLAGIAIGGGRAWGWRWWQARAEQRLLDGRGRVPAGADGRSAATTSPAAEQHADALVAAYPDTGYAEQAELAAARVEMENGKAAAAGAPAARDARRRPIEPRADRAPAPGARAGRPEPGRRGARDAERGAEAARSRRASPRCVATRCSPRAIAPARSRLSRGQPRRRAAAGAAGRHGGELLDSQDQRR